MPAQTFRKKPVVVEAIPVAEALQAASRSWFDLPSWLIEAYEHGNVIFGQDRVEIATLEGRMTAGMGDWIIQGVQGELYPCKPDIFEATYEPAEAVSR